MFIPKKQKGGSYTNPVTSSGISPTSQELFNAAVISSSIDFQPSISEPFDQYVESISQTRPSDILSQNMEYYQQISTNNSTIDGYNAIIENLSPLTPMLRTNMESKKSIWQTAKTNYENAVNTYSQLTSQYLEGEAEYSSSISSYVGYSTIEELSTARYIEEYGYLFNTTFTYSSDEFGPLWIPVASVNPIEFQSGGQNSDKNIKEVLASYSSIQLRDYAQRFKNMESHFSSMISTYTVIVEEERQEIESIMENRYYPQTSTISTLYAQLIIATENDKINDENISTISSSNNAKMDEYSRLFSTYKGYVDAYNTTSSALVIQSGVRRTAYELYTFQMLQSSIMMNEGHLNSTLSMKTELELIQALQAEGQDITNAYNTLLADFPGIQVGGDRISNMLNTVNILYTRYSTQVHSLQEQQASLYPNMSPDESRSYILQTGYETKLEEYSDAKKRYKELYEDILPSTNIISSLLSTQRGIYDIYVVSTPTDDYIRGQYEADIDNYSTILMTMYGNAQSTKQQYYIFRNSSIELHAMQDSQKMSIKQEIQRLIEIGADYKDVAENMTLTDSIIDTYIPEIKGLVSGSQIGLLGYLRDLSTATASQIEEMYSTIYKISSQTLVLSGGGSTALNTLIANVQGTAFEYNKKLQFANVCISTQVKCEIDTYINTLAYISSSLIENLLINNYTIEELSYNYNGSFIESLDPLSSQTITSLSTKSASLRPLINSTSIFIDMLTAEKTVKKYYVEQKSAYELQSYYEFILASPAIYKDMLSSYNFNILAITYDLTIQNVNNYVRNREAYWNMYSGLIQSITARDIFDPSILEDLKNTKNVYKSKITSWEYKIPPFFPLSKMIYNYAPLRKNLYMRVEPIIQAEFNCEPLIVSEVQRITNAPTSTKPVDSTVYGLQGQYVRIKTPNKPYEILQVLVIDSTGKNVAYGASVSAPSIGTAALKSITNGSYNTGLPQSFSYTSSTSGYIWINLGSVYDITGVEILKTGASAYSSVGYSVQIFASDQTTPVGSAQETFANTANQILDFRTKETNLKTGKEIPILRQDVRFGTCGILARYLRIYPSSQGFLQISQVAIVGSDRTNIAANIIPTIFGTTATFAGIGKITDETYYSRPLPSCFVASLPLGAYVQIDLGTEKDIVAVDFYNTNTGTSYQLGTRLELYTSDNQLVVENTLKTNNKKEVVDYRSDSTCSAEMLWPPFYGVAGIIAQYVGIERSDNGALGFSKLQIIDKTGTDIGLFKDTYAVSAVNPARLAVTNYSDSQPAEISYKSAEGPPTQKIVVDLGQLYEICAVNVFACSDAPTLLGNAALKFYNESVGATSFFSKSLVLDGLSTFVDTRYDPEESQYPTTLNKSNNVYGLFGTLAISIKIPGSPTKIQVTEATGQDIVTELSTESGSTTIILTRSEHPLEITSVVVSDGTPGTMVTVYGCNGVIVNVQPLEPWADPVSQNIYLLADFRQPAKNPYAPMIPLPSKTYSDISNNPTILSLYSEVNADLGISNMPPLGVIARYVKIIPRDTTTRLYLSQIAVVDSRGINVAVNKPTFTPSGTRGTSAAVDGILLQDVTNPFVVLDNYITKPEEKSFVSALGAQESNYWVVDLKNEYFINSVIYVASKYQYDSGHNVIVELYDADLRRVRVKLVSQYVSLFGTDILDFRTNRSASAYSPGAWLEICKEVVQMGPNNCGIMGQYLRVINAPANTGPIIISQIIATDVNGNNIALYKPTYSSTNNQNGFMVVDGTYYQRTSVNSYNSIPGSASLDYVEVNFGLELEIVNLYLIVASDAPTTTLNIEIYNSNRYLISKYNATNTNYSNIPVNGQNFVSPPDNLDPMYINSEGGTFQLPVVGISILEKLSKFTVSAGLMNSSVVPLNPQITLTTRFSGTGVCVSSPTFANLRNDFTRGTNSEIPVRYIRIYNVNRYIQISQVMAYGFDGTNYAYQKTCFASSIFPGTYVATVTDGEGGYFHTPRPASQCFKSGGEIYDYVEIDLGTTYQIAAIRCIFSSDNGGENVGAQIQLLDENRACLAQHIVSSAEYQVALVDFRIQPASPSIKKIITPKINSVESLPSGLSRPNGLTEDVSQNLYIVDTVNHCIWSSETTYFGTAGTVATDLTGLNYPVGIATDGTNFYVADYGNNRILKIVGGTATLFATMTNPYALNYNDGTLYCSAYNTTGGIHCFTTGTGTVSALPVIPTPFAYPNSIVVTDNFFYVSSGTTGFVYRISTGPDHTCTSYIGKTATISLPLISVSAIAYDASNNIIFISDFVQDKVFAACLSPVITYSIAGTGNGGFSGDGAQGSLATLDGPMNLLYSPKKGYLYISDYKNKRVRYLQLYSVRPIQITTTDGEPAWLNWPTPTLPTLSITTQTVPAPVETTANTLKIITTVSQISNWDFDTYNIFSIVVSRAGNFYVVGVNEPTPQKYYIYKLDTKTNTLSAVSNMISAEVACVAESLGKLYILQGSTSNGTVTINTYTEGSRIINTSFATPSYKVSTNKIRGATWIEFDKNNVMYIADTGNHCISYRNALNSMEVRVGTYGQTQTGIITGHQTATTAVLGNPGPFVFDSYNNLIFIDTGTNVLYKVTADNKIAPICPTSAGQPGIDTITKISSFPISAGSVQINGANGITIDGSDSLYITTLAQQIVKLSIDSQGNYWATIVAGLGSNGAANFLQTDTVAQYASLNNPSEIRFYQNKLYFLDGTVPSDNDTSSYGNYIRSISFEVSTEVPKSAIVPYGPLLYTVNNTKNTNNTTVSSGDESIGILLNNFESYFVCCNTSGLLYFGNQKTGAILSLDVSNNITVVVNSATTTDDGETAIGAEFIPAGIAIYNDAYLYFIDETTGSLYCYLIAANYWYSIATVSDFPSLNIVIAHPIGYIFFNYSNMENTEYYIGVQNVRASPTAPFTSATYTITAPAMITSMTVDIDGNLYVATGSVIYKYTITYDSSGNATIGSQESLLELDSYGAIINGLAYYNGNIYYSINSCVYYYPVDKSSGSVLVAGTVASATLIAAAAAAASAASSADADAAAAALAAHAGAAVDGSYSTTTSLNYPQGLCFDLNGTMYILDQINKTNYTTVLLKNTKYQSLQPDLTYTIAGSNTQTNDLIFNKLAYMVDFNLLNSVCYDTLGQIYLCDTGSSCISKIDLSGVINVYAGRIGTSGYEGDGGSPTSASLNAPKDIKMSISNVLYIADTGNNCIRRVKILGSGQVINTFGGTFTNPVALAIDTNENVYVVCNSVEIRVISQTEQVSLFYTASSEIGAIVLDSNNNVYFTADSSVYKISNASATPVASGLSLCKGLCFDASNNLYISDTGNNRIYKIPAGSTALEPYIGNGTPEYTFASDSALSQNIYGNGSPRLERAISSPGALSFDSTRGLLIAQPTKATLSCLQASSTVPKCGTSTTSIVISNPNAAAVYLSQVVVLNSSGMNIALKTTGDSYLDGFYGPKPIGSSFEIAAGASQTITVSDTITCILLYLSADGGSYTKAAWNGCTVSLGTGSTRTITGISASPSYKNPSLQYIVFDYRSKTPYCTPFYNYVNKYRLQDSATAITTNYREQYVRYVRITRVGGSNVYLSQVAILHAETGKNLALKSINYDQLDGSYYYANGLYCPNNGLSSSSAWVEFDLKDEYPIDQVILYSNVSTISYSVMGYTNNRTQVQCATASILDPLVAFIRIQGSGLGNIVLNTIPTIVGGTIASRLYYSSVQNTTTSSVYYTSAGSTNAEYIEFTLSASSIIRSITLSVIAQNHQLILYNSARTELFRTAINTTPITITSPVKTNIQCYSFLPITGTRGVRYVKSSTAVNLTAIDKNGIQVGSGTGLTLDLGQEYEIVQVIATPSGSGTIQLLDSSQVLISSPSLQGTTSTAATAVYDCRYGDTKYLPLTYSPTASTDSTLRGSINGRYVRFECPINISAAITIGQIAIYDIYGKIVSNGKPTFMPNISNATTNYSAPTCSLTSSGVLYYSDSGAQPVSIKDSNTGINWWEVDLGQQYLIKDIYIKITSTASFSIPYIIYSSYREEVYRSFYNYTANTAGTSIISAPLTPYTNPTVNTNTMPIRFIRISFSSIIPSATSTLANISVIDSRGMDIAKWKPVRYVDASNNVYYTANIAGTNFSIKNVWEMDLGSDYNVCSIIISVTAGLSYSKVSAYNSSGSIVKNKINLTSILHTLVLNSTTTDPTYTSVQNTLAYGKRTRYVTLSTSSNMIFNTIVIIDSLGRNIAYNSLTHLNTVLPYNVGTNTSTNSPFLKIDLGQEYYVAFIIVYYYRTGTYTTTSTPTYNTSLNGGTLILMDSVSNISATKTLIGSSNNILWNATTTSGTVAAPTYSFSSILYNSLKTYPIKQIVFIGSSMYVIVNTGIYYSISNTTVISNTQTSLTAPTYNDSGGTLRTANLYPISLSYHGTNMFVTYRAEAPTGAASPPPIQPYYQYGTTGLKTLLINNDVPASTISSIFIGINTVFFNVNGGIYTMPKTSLSNISWNLTSTPIPCSSPYNIVADSSDNVIFIDNNKVYKSSTGGATTTEITTTEIGSGISTPTGLAIDSNNYVYVIDGDNIRMIDTSNTTYTFLSNLGATPSCITVNSKILYIALSNLVIKQASLISSNRDYPFIGPYKTTDTPLISGINFIGTTYAEIIDTTT